MNQLFCAHMQDFKCCVFDNISSVSSPGRKEDGQGGIMFDNEDEKDQWEEDQKVSGTVIPLLIHQRNILW